MKDDFGVLCFVIVVFLGITFVAGYITGCLVSHDPTPEQCLNVCVDAFERMNC